MASKIALGVLGAIEQLKQGQVPYQHLFDQVYLMRILSLQKISMLIQRHGLQDCTAVPGVIEQLKCKARSLRQEMLVLEKEVERLEEATEGEVAPKGIYHSPALVIENTRDYCLHAAPGRAACRSQE